jgi:hypothetical protein
MRHLWAVMVVLALGVLVPRGAAAQEQSTPPPHDTGPKFSLGQNYPNPFNPTTTIPFTLGDAPSCTDSGRMYRVTLQIYNILAQLVAIPILQGGGGAGQPVRELELPCGSYTAYWDGNIVNTSEEAASGVYLYRLQVDGRVVVKKMLVAK